MTMQTEIVDKYQVPGVDGTIECPGWARSETMEYTRSHIHAPWFRKKEWDYYLFTNNDIGLAFTISDLGYAGLLSVSFLDFRNGKYYTDSELAWFPRGKVFGLGKSTSDATGSCHTKRLDLVYTNEAEGRRHISCSFRNFKKEWNLTAEIDVYRTMDDALYICTPWKEKPTAFYYNCKMNCLEAEGRARIGDEEFTLTRETTLGVLDWGRGVWTYDNTWYWGTLNGRLHGEPFGFNLGYGFSDRSAASENAMFYKGRLHKLGEVTFHIPERDGKRQYTENWKLTSDDGRFEGEFAPIFDRADAMNFVIIVTEQHQVFGRLTGTAISDDGEKVEFSDIICAVEVVHNKY